MPKQKTSAYPRNVFINCPFDPQYTEIFEAIVFTIMVCGFQPLSARRAVAHHENDFSKAIAEVRHLLASESKQRLPGPQEYRESLRRIQIEASRVSR